MPHKDEPIGVMIVEDEPGVREALVDALQGSGRIRVMGDFDRAEEALSALAHQRAEVVLVDLELPGLSGTGFVAACRERCPEVQCIVLTVHDEAAWVFPALTAGASGYFIKGTPPARLVEAIQQVRDGGSEMTPSVARLVLKSFRGAPPAGGKGGADGKGNLTPREREVLECLSRGMTYDEIGEHLGCHARTVNSHLHNTYRKLHVHSAAGAVGRYLRDG
ncbi:MAG: response regulator transcription factor [Verrucomicrobiales bacterium]|nr:response regulator transcription factor [Verrucomicrobiales bacterium]